MAKKQAAKPEEAAPPQEAAKPAAEAAPAPEKEKEKKKAAPKAKAAKQPAAPEAPGKTAPAEPAPAAAPAPAAPAVAAAMEPTKKKGKRPGVPPKRGKKAKNQRKVLAQKLAKLGPVPVKQAIALLKEHKRVKFDESVEVHMCLGIDPKQADQMVRGSVALPHGIGKTVRLLIFAQGDNAAKAKAAGADHVGADDLAKKIQEGWLDFDAALATPDMMSVVGRLGKILGPRGLMPTPKAGTVITGDVAAAVREFKAGKVEYRADAGGNVHAPVGKLSFDEPKLLGNIAAFIDQIRAAKPSAAKGNYIKSITVSATMSPGIPVTA
jgi:large subunit ribosomal protein L1